MSIQFEKVGFIYSDKTPFKYEALKDIDLSFEMGNMTAIIGATGSGKSTLIQHLNALLLPTSGKLKVIDKIIDSKVKPKGLKMLRKQVGLVFQFPEYQLFEETVLKDVAFGPLNFGLSNDEALARAKNALAMVKIGKEYYEKSPLILSGGEKRRVAIAGLLALDPSILVLDEPTAALDPRGSVDIMNLFKSLNENYNKTILIVTHDMENVLKYCDDVVVLEKGRLKYKGEVKSFFSDSKLCIDMGILPPIIVRFKDMLNERGFNLDESILDIKSLTKAIKKELL